jgi:hypothetical protein
MEALRAAFTINVLKVMTILQHHSDPRVLPPSNAVYTFCLPASAPEQ